MSRNIERVDAKIEEEREKKKIREKVVVSKPEVRWPHAPPQYRGKVKRIQTSS